MEPYNGAAKSGNYQIGTTCNTTSESEHVGVAQKMAAEIVSNFNHKEQNEVVFLIRGLILEARDKSLSQLRHEAEERQNYAKEVSDLYEQLASNSIR